MTAKTPAERQRAYRARKGAKDRPGPEPTAPHGTRSGYKRHKRNGEDPCAACRQAHNDWHRDYYARHPRA